MSVIFLKIYDFFKGRKHLLFILIFLLVALFSFLSSRLYLNEDIFELFSHDEALKDQRLIFDKIKSNDKIVIIFSTNDTSTVAVNNLIYSADEVSEKIKQQLIPEHARELIYSVSDSFAAETYEMIYRNLPFFLEKKDYEHIEKLITPENVSAVLDANYKMLVSFAGFATKKYITRDPFGFTNLALKNYMSANISNDYLLFNDRIFSKDKKNLLMFLSSVFSASESSKNSILIKKLDQIIAEQNSKGVVQIHSFGATPVSVCNSRQLTVDTIITMGAALIILFLFFAYFFRQKRTFLFLLLPVLFGGLFSLALVYLLKGHISTIALGTGSVILGIAINYSIHFFTHFHFAGSARETLKDITMPMMIGSITTVGAFLGLLFVKSPILNDFGLMSALVILGSLLFSMIFLPHFVGSKLNTEINVQRKSYLTKILSYSFEKNKYIIIGIGLLTMIFLFLTKNVGFESDMKKLSFFTAGLKGAEQKLNSFSDSTLEDIFIISKGKTLNEALKNSEKIKEKINLLKNDSLIGQVYGASHLLFSDSLQKVKLSTWESFWDSNRREILKKNFLLCTGQYHFRSNAFDEFFAMLDKDYIRMNKNDFEKIKQTQVQDYIDEVNEETSVITMIRVKPGNKNVVLSAIPTDRSTSVIENKNLFTQFLDVIRDDFNVILILSSLLVFTFLLLSYGRIELAVIAFIPMLVSWIWILGLMSLFGIEFNIFSVVISAFIFGLGDDYSIFIMDGLLQKYKKGQQVLTTHKTAVLLSAFTMLVGIGVLIFAKHPVLKSIAVLTIVGMFSVVFLSYTIIPALFNCLVYQKNKLRRFPVTIYNLCYAAVCYTYFTSGSIMSALLGATLIKILPVTRKFKQYLFHYCLYFVCKTTMYLMYFTRKNIINYSPDIFKKPSIIIPNHQSFIDIPLHMMFSPKIIMITNDAFYYSKTIGVIIRMANFMPASAGFQTIVDKLSDAVKDGYSIVIFPEGTRSNNQKVHRFHKGAFYLAEKLKLDIQPIVVHGSGNYISKGDLLGRKSLLTIKFLNKIQHDDTSWGNDYTEKTKTVQQYFRKEYNKVLTEYYYDTKQIKDLVIKNFIYKGPILEWYTRIKLILEKNYQLFNSLIPENAKILDAGCGYGHMSLMLSLVCPERQITAIDYDEDKIKVATHCTSKPPNVDFSYADVRNFGFEKYDVVILSDVLHYLNESSQVELLKKSVNSLNRNGIILIRDGFQDIGKKHKNTRLTELFSTNVGFNKMENKKMNFITINWLTELVRNLGMGMEVISQQKNTSNSLIKLYRKENDL